MNSVSFEQQTKIELPTMTFGSLTKTETIENRLPNCYDGSVDSSMRLPLGSSK